MKRTPLTRKTPLGRGTKALQHGGALKRTGPIKPKRQPRMTDAQVERLKRGKAILGCVACIKNLHFTNLLEQGWRGTGQKVEGHHILSGGRRIGHEFVILLCGWHHQGEPVEGLGKKATAARHGPSLATEKRRFVECYGTELDLLAYQNRLLREKERAT